MTRNRPTRPTTTSRTGLRRRTAWLLPLGQTPSEQVLHGIDLPAGARR